MQPTYLTNSGFCYLIGFEEFKKSLGPAAQKMRDKQIEHLREKQDLFAEAVFNYWLKQMSQLIDKSNLMEKSKEK